MHIGFRIEPRVSLYRRQVVEDLVTDWKVDLQSTYPSLRKYGIPGDFRFIIIHRVYYPESSDNRQQNLLMSIDVYKRQKEAEEQLKKANEEKLQSAKKLLQAGVSADIVASTLNLSMDLSLIHI